MLECRKIRAPEERCLCSLPFWEFVTEMMTSLLTWLFHSVSCISTQQSKHAYTYEGNTHGIMATLVFGQFYIIHCEDFLQF